MVDDRGISGTRRRLSYREPPFATSGGQASAYSSASSEVEKLQTCTPAVGMPSIVGSHREPDQARPESDG